MEEYVAMKKREYQNDYRRNNPDKVKEWRKNAIVKAYVKLIAAEPERAVHI